MTEHTNVEVTTEIPTPNPIPTVEINSATPEVELPQTPPTEPTEVHTETTTHE